MASRRIALLVARRACRRLEWESCPAEGEKNLKSPHPTPYTLHPTPDLLLVTDNCQLQITHYQRPSTDNLRCGATTLQI
ncbi:hypothetical protein [Chroococcidiopsis sp.]|uniref:hypothetical protein n=1 Tax=Chroococcidiopsis sp. TaxID=3088168 RepID=UPI003F37FCDC